MPLSRYLKIFPYPENPDHSIVYSTRTTSLVILCDEAIEALKLGEESVEIAEPLRNLGILVDNTVKEREGVFGMLDEINRLSPNLRAAVILTLDCNFNCVYCFEGTLKDKLYMSREKADQVVAFFEERLKPVHKRCILDFYGGEPLLSVKMIKYLCMRMQEVMAKKGGEYECNLVTNGSLLTEKTVRELLPLGLKHAKITIDGPPDIHNTTRPFKSGQPSFEVIVTNIKACCNLVPITVSGNYTEENYHRFPELLDRLKAEGITPEKLENIKFNPVIRTTDQYSLQEFAGGCTCADEPWIAEAAIILREEILKRGYPVDKPSPQICMIDVDESHVIHYNGDLYKCMPLIGHEQFKAGDIRSGINDFSKAYCKGHWQKEEKCRECEYLPLCFGGCRYMVFERQGDMNGIQCQKTFFDRSLETFLRQEVGQRSEDGSR